MVSYLQKGFSRSQVQALIELHLGAIDTATSLADKKYHRKQVKEYRAILKARNGKTPSSR